ncbi:MAG TPA: NIL domain-containing protein [Chthonomonadaceae bacterium]|nr:NIL domain-containing protein [Chthonomonadaceae bacterium]
MPVVTVELTADSDSVGQPIIWRLGKLFNVVTNIRRARVTEDYGHVALTLEGSTGEVEQAANYLRSLGLLKDTDASAPSAPSSAAPPEEAIPRPSSIYVRLSTVNAAQGQTPLLYRVGKDFNVVVNLERAAFDDEEGGWVEITISGPLSEVQRAIAFLHTTGLHVNPRQRSVTDYGNL